MNITLDVKSTVYYLYGYGIHLNLNFTSHTEGNSMLWGSAMKQHMGGFVGGLLNQMFNTFSMFCCVAMYPNSQSIRYKPETILNHKSWDRVLRGQPKVRVETILTKTVTLKIAWEWDRNAKKNSRRLMLHQSPFLFGWLCFKNCSVHFGTRLNLLGILEYSG